MVKEKQVTWQKNGCTIWPFTPGHLSVLKYLGWIRTCALSAHSLQLMCFSAVASEQLQWWRDVNLVVPHRGSPRFVLLFSFFPWGLRMAKRLPSVVEERPPMDRRGTTQNGFIKNRLVPLNAAGSSYFYASCLVRINKPAGGDCSSSGVNLSLCFIQQGKISAPFSPYSQSK